MSKVITKVQYVGKIYRFVDDTGNEHFLVKNIDGRLYGSTIWNSEPTVEFYEALRLFDQN